MCGQGGARGWTSYTQLIMLSKWESIMCQCCIKQFYISIKIIFLINQSKCSQWIVLVQSSGKSGLLQAVKLWIVWTQQSTRGIQNQLSSLALNTPVNWLLCKVYNVCPTFVHTNQKVVFHTPYTGRVLMKLFTWVQKSCSTITFN